MSTREPETSGEGSQSTWLNWLIDRACVFNIFSID